MKEPMFRVNERTEPELARVRFAVDYGSALRPSVNPRSFMISEHIRYAGQLTDPLAARGFGRGISALAGLYTKNGSSLDEPLQLSSHTIASEITVMSMDIPEVITMDRLKKVAVEFGNDYKSRLAGFDPKIHGARTVFVARAALGGLVKRAGITAFEAVSEKAQTASIDWGLNNIRPDATGAILMRMNSAHLMDSNRNLNQHSIGVLTELRAEHDGLVKYAIEIDSNTHTLDDYLYMLQAMDENFPGTFLMSYDLAWMTEAGVDGSVYTSVDMTRVMEKVLDTKGMFDLLVSVELNPLSKYGNGHTDAEHEINDNFAVGKMLAERGNRAITFFHETGPTVDRPADQIARNTDQVIAGMLDG